MSLDEVRALIESEDFAAELGIASGYKSFLQALEKSTAFQHLLEFLKSEYGNVGKITKLVQSLSDQKVDYRYQNPNDTALATYARAIKLVAPGSAQVAGGFLLDAANTWWARQVAEQVLKDPTTQLPLSSLSVKDWLNLSTDILTIAIPSSNVLQSTLIANFLSVGQWRLTSFSGLSFKTISSSHTPDINKSRAPSHTSNHSDTKAFFWEAAT